MKPPAALGQHGSPRGRPLRLITPDVCHPVRVPSRDDVLSAWWEDLRREIGQVVDEIDPEGLVAMGAPSGEYSTEMDRLTSLVVHDDVREQPVLAVWERASGPGSRLSRRPDPLTTMTGRLLTTPRSRPRP